MKVLVVEDHDWRAAEVANAIEWGGIVHAKTVQHARSILTDLGPDVIVMDHDLDLDGTKRDAGSGTEIVTDLERLSHDEKPLVIVHSKNAPAAVGMVARLVASGYPTAWIPMTRLDVNRSAPHQLDALRAILRGWQTL